MRFRPDAPPFGGIARGGGVLWGGGGGKYLFEPNARCTELHHASAPGITMQFAALGETLAEWKRPALSKVGMYHLPHTQEIPIVFLVYAPILVAATACALHKMHPETRRGEWRPGFLPHHCGHVKCNKPPGTGVACTTRCRLSICIAPCYAVRLHAKPLQTPTDPRMCTRFPEPGTNEYGTFLDFFPTPPLVR